MGPDRTVRVNAAVAAGNNQKPRGSKLEAKARPAATTI